MMIPIIDTIAILIVAGSKDSCAIPPNKLIPRSREINENRKLIINRMIKIRLNLLGFDIVLPPLNRITFTNLS